MNKKNIRIGAAIEWLEENGWTEIIDPRWTLEVKRELENPGLGLTEEEIRSVLDVVIFPKPDYAHNEKIDEVLKLGKP